MSYVEAAIRSVALADSAVSALIGTRYYAVGEVPQNATRPYIVAQRVTTARTHQMQSDSDLVDALVQLSAVADSYTGCLDLITALRAVLQDYSGTALGVEISRVFLDAETDLGYDFESKAHTRVLEIRVWYRE